MLIVSLTCLPTRLENIENFLNSMQEQIKQPDKIIINYPNKCLRLNIDYDVNKLKEILEKLFTKTKTKSLKDKIYLNITKDYGPITKIYPLINLDFIKNDDIIVILDDDNYYNKYLIQNLYNEFIKYNKKQAICVSGLLYPKKLNSPYYCIRPNNNCNLMEAAFGYIIERSFLKKDLNSWIIDVDNYDEVVKNNFNNSFLSDDYVISRYLDKYNILKRVINYDFNLNKTNCFLKDKIMNSNDALCSLGHNLDKYVKSEIELKLRNLM